MDQILGMLRPEVIAAMVLCPVVLQYVRRFVPTFAQGHAAVTNFGVVAGVALWALKAQWIHPTPEGIVLTVTQVAIAWFLSDKWFTQMVEPMAKSSNPLMPSATNGGSK